MVGKMAARMEVEATTAVGLCAHLHPAVVALFVFSRFGRSLLDCQHEFLLVGKIEKGHTSWAFRKVYFEGLLPEDMPTICFNVFLKTITQEQACLFSRALAHDVRRDACYRKIDGRRQCFRGFHSNTDFDRRELSYEKSGTLIKSVFISD